MDKYNKDLQRALGVAYKQAWDELCADEPKEFSEMSSVQRGEAIREKIINKVYNLIGAVESEATDDQGGFHLQWINVPKRPKLVPVQGVWVWAKNDDALRNGSFVREDSNGIFTSYMNGDYMGGRTTSQQELRDLGYQASDPDYAKHLVPKGCQVK